MEINLHGCISIEMDEREYNFCTVTTVTVTTKHQERLHLKLFHDKENNILFDFMDNFDNTTTKNSEVMSFNLNLLWHGAKWCDDCTGF